MILCSTGALYHRTANGSMYVPNAPGDHACLWPLVAALPIEGIEVLMPRVMTRLNEVAEEIASECPVPVGAVHAPKDLGPALPDVAAFERLVDVCRFTATLGARTVVLHLWDMPDSDTDFAGRLAVAHPLADVAAAHDVEIAVETIPCTRASPLPNLERLLEHEPRLKVTLDTEFLAMHDELGAALQADWLWPAVRHIHFKDFDGRPTDEHGRRRYVLPGDGALDFPAIFSTLADRRFDGTVSLEATQHQPDGLIDVPALTQSLGRMSRSPWQFR